MQIPLVALQGYGFAPEDNIPLGSLPALTEIHMSDMLEGDPGLNHFVYSRFHAQDSLKNLQVSDHCPASTACHCHYSSQKLLDITAPLAAASLGPALLHVS